MVRISSANRLIATLLLFARAPVLALDEPAETPPALVRRLWLESLPSALASALPVSDLLPMNSFFSGPLMARARLSACSSQSCARPA
jgi:hypothetical protein